MNINRGIRMELNDVRDQSIKVREVSEVSLKELKENLSTLRQENNKNEVEMIQKIIKNFIMPNFDRLSTENILVRRTTKEFVYSKVKEILKTFKTLGSDRVPEIAKQKVLDNKVRTIDAVYIARNPKISDCSYIDIDNEKEYKRKMEPFAEYLINEDGELLRTTYKYNVIDEGTNDLSSRGNIARKTFEELRVPQKISAEEMLYDYLGNRYQVMNDILEALVGNLSKLAEFKGIDVRFRIALRENLSEQIESKFITEKIREQLEQKYAAYIIQKNLQTERSADDGIDISNIKEYIDKQVGIYLEESRKGQLKRMEQALNI